MPDSRMSKNNSELFFPKVAELLLWSRCGSNSNPIASAIEWYALTNSSTFYYYTTPKIELKYLG